jgi:chemotaxis protein methyltransferase CheR
LNRVAQDPAYSRLKDHLLAQTGLAFYADRDQQLSELIGGRLSYLGLRNCASYGKFLADGEKGTAETEVLIAQLTIGETYFFRDPETFAAIRDVILPDILERKQASRQLRIWSAGCATGAEPYSLAILLMDQLAGRMDGWQIAIHATDLNRGYLTQAAEGKFRASALRSLSDEMKSECFSKEGRLWSIHPRYKQWISFQQMNLVDSEFSTPWAADTYFDLILCRNVMIYFAPEVNRRLVGRLHHSLGVGGWLVVGAAEHNLENYQAFHTVDGPGTKLYRKPPADVAQALMPAASRLISTPERSVGTSAGAAGMSACATPGVEGLRQLVDRGHWQEAAEIGQDMLTRDRLNPEIHFYQALIFENLGIVEQAEQSLRHAIYLDRKFALAHYHLGLALKRDGQLRASARSFGNVLKVLAALPDDTVVTAGPGVTATGLRELAKMQLQESSAA